MRRTLKTHVFLVSSAFLFLPLVSNTRIRPTRACSGCLGCLSPSPSCQTPKTPPMWACFWCLTHPFPSQHVEHQNMSPQGRVLVFGVFSAFPSCRTPRTCPCGQVFGVRHVLCPSFRVEHHQRALVGMFVVYGAFPAIPLVLDTTNMPLWACFWCSALPLVSNTTNVPIEARLWCLTRSLPFRSCRTPPTCPQRRVCGVRHVLCPSARVKHHQRAHRGAFVVFSAVPGAVSLLLP